MHENLVMTMPESVTITNTALGPGSVPSDAGHGDHFCTESSAGTQPPSPPYTNQNLGAHCGDQAILSMGSVSKRSPCPP